MQKNIKDNNIMITGKHLIADVINITKYELLNTLDGIKPLMEKIINELKLTVVGQIHHQFEPVGATCLYLLSESHLSIHTYPEMRCCTIDLYCCNDRINLEDALEIIYEYFDRNSIITKHILNR